MPTKRGHDTRYDNQIGFNKNNTRFLHALLNKDLCKYFLIIPLFWPQGRRCKYAFAWHFTTIHITDTPLKHGKIANNIRRHQFHMIMFGVSF